MPATTEPLRAYWKVQNTTRPGEGDQALTLRLTFPRPDAVSVYAANTRQLGRVFERRDACCDTVEGRFGTRAGPKTVDAVQKGVVGQAEKLPRVTARPARCPGSSPATIRPGPDAHWSGARGLSAYVPQRSGTPSSRRRHIGSAKWRNGMAARPSVRSPARRLSRGDARWARVPGARWPSSPTTRWMGLPDTSRLPAPSISQGAGATFESPSRWTPAPLLCRVGLGRSRCRVRGPVFGPGMEAAKAPLRACVPDAPDATCANRGAPRFLEYSRGTAVEAPVALLPRAVRTGGDGMAKRSRTWRRSTKGQHEAFDQPGPTGRAKSQPLHAASLSSCPPPFPAPGGARAYTRVSGWENQKEKTQFNGPNPRGTVFHDPGLRRKRKAGMGDRRRPGGLVATQPGSRGIEIGRAATRSRAH